MKSLRNWLLLSALALPGAAPARDQSTAAISELPSAASAPIALLADLSSGQILFAREANQRFLPASMTKAMTALVAFDLISAGKRRESDRFVVRADTAKRWAEEGTTLNLRAGESVTVHDLLMGTIAVSANDAASVLAEGAGGSVSQWTAAMNERAETLGMAGRHFASANGSPDGGKTYVTANDLVRLARALIQHHPELYRRYFGQQAMLWHGAKLRSHDPLSGMLPGADGIKTGHSFEAGFNYLGSVERQGRRMVLVIARAPTEPGRASAARKLAEWGFEAWDSAVFLDPGFAVGEAWVQGGNARGVRLGVPRRYALSISRGGSRVVSATITYDGPLRAPLAKGQQVARLTVHLAGQPDHVLPLVALDAIDPAGPIDRIANGLLGLLE